MERLDVLVARLEMAICGLMDVDTGCWGDLAKSPLEYFQDLQEAHTKYEGAYNELKAALRL